MPQIGFTTLNESVSVTLLEETFYVPFDRGITSTITGVEGKLFPSGEL